jgi:alkylresorcinol/alkylpyrone synthase
VTPATRPATTIAAVRGVLPEHRYPQAEITAAFADFCLVEGRNEGRRAALLHQFHSASRVSTRHLALPLDEYPKLDGFGAANDAFIRTALDLGEQAVTDGLRAAGLGPRDVDMILTTSVTGVAAPSVDARLVNRLGLRPDVKRVPVFGLGCVAGAAGIARLDDYLRGWPDHVAVLLSVELCSLTVQRDDPSLPNLVASGLFGDGAAAVVAVGAGRAPGVRPAGPQVVAARSRFYPDTERVMGWDIGGSGFRIVLSAEVPALIERHLHDDVTAFLAEHGLTPADVVTWVCHPGGPKVLEAITRALRLPASALQPTWDSLARVGNLSSASVLHVLADTITHRRPAPGQPGLLLAMGPGFCAELVLLRW